MLSLLQDDDHLCEHRKQQNQYEKKFDLNSDKIR